MTISENSRVVGSESVVMCELDKGLALLDLNRGRYFSLNSTGTLVWSCIEQPASVDEICAVVAKRFEIGLDVCRRDIVDLLQQLVDSGLVRAIDAPAA